MSVEIYSYDHEIVPIDRIEFSVLGNYEVKNMSSISEPQGISKPESYNNFEQVIGGLVDKRLGVIDEHIECGTCGLGSIKCPGHFGHIELAEPVYHIGYMQYIKKILSCICIRCSKILVNKNDEIIKKILKNKTGKNRLKEIKNITSSVSYCQRDNYGCGAVVPKIKVDIKKATSAVNIIAELSVTSADMDMEDGSETEQFEGRKKIRQNITPHMCYNVLRNISDEDCIILGIDPAKTRPEMMILKTFPVPPIQVRPSAKADFLASATYEDDLTLKLADIVSANTRIKKYKEKDNAKSEYSMENSYLLQYHVATYFDNDSKSLLKSEQRNGHALKSISSRLKEKKGRIRGNLMGKRVDFSSRTVIGGDPNIKVNELGVPLRIAMNLTFPEVVTPENIERLSMLVRNGRSKYPGANFVFPISSFSKNKKYILDLRYNKKNVILRFGDIVERHIQNGDVVLFNRQPSLHKLSMLAHKIRILPESGLLTFKLNLAVTSPYNADFDGDEMNMFVPQSVQTQVELDMLANVMRQIISPKNSSPIIGCVMDSVIGSFLLTSDKTKIDWKDMMNLLMYVELDKYDVKKKEYTGKEMFSYIIPKKINLYTNSDSGPVEIINGDIIKGHMQKSTIGPKKNSIVHQIWFEYNMEETQKFIDNAQRLVDNWLMSHGFTVSVGDGYVPQHIKMQIYDIVDTKKLEIDHLITEMENNPDVMDETIFENSIAGDLNALGGTINELITSNLDEKNNFYLSVTSGSKGNKLNIGQIAGVLGQQNVEQKRIKKRINNRTLCHYYQNDDSMLARGFCENSFLTGLTPQEFYFHMMAGREGLIDTAIKTAETGYIQRKLIKALEDISMKYDGTVRNSNDTVIQFLYGGANVDMTKQIEQKLKIVAMTNIEIEKKYKFTKSEMKQVGVSDDFNNLTFNTMIKMRDELRIIQERAQINYTLTTDKYMLPSSFMTVINNAIRLNKPASDKYTELRPKFILKTINELLESSDINIVFMSKRDRNNKESLKYNDDKKCKTLLKIALYEYLAPKRCIYEYKFTKDTFLIVIKKIKNDIIQSRINAGEMIGVVAGQSIGEPATQLSIVGTEQIEICDKKMSVVYKGSIGKFIDDIIIAHPNKTIDLGNSSLETATSGYYIKSVKQDGTTVWAEISHTSRHPANGDLVKITTRLGKQVTGTCSHSFLTRKEGKVVPIKGSELKIGDCMPLDSNIIGNKDGCIVWDDIIKIDVIKNYNKKVYDFTVPNIETFLLQSGIYVHNTLNTFHFTGVASKGTGMLGVPRLVELLGLSKNIKKPTMTVYFNKDIMENEKIVHKIAAHMEYTTLHDLAMNVEIYYDPQPFNNSYRARDMVTNDFKILAPTKASCQNNIEDLPWLLVIKLDKEKMFDKNVTLLDIKSKFCTFWMSKLENPKSLKKNDRLLMDKVTQISISTNYDNSVVPIIHIRYDMSKFDLNSMIDFQNIIVNKFRLKGIDKIKKIKDVSKERVLTYDDDGSIKRKDHHVVYTDGINLVDIRYINGIDLLKTTTSDIISIYKHFGIEAARTALIKELYAVLSSSGSVNYQHIAILVDLMTNTGGLTSIDRHGINKLDTDPLMRVSFEQMVEQFMTAAVFNEVDSIRSVSSRIMVGQVIKGGTGLCDIMMDNNMLENSEYVEEYDIPLSSSFNMIDKSKLIDDTMEREEYDLFMPDL